MPLLLCWNSTFKSDLYAFEMIQIAYAQGNLKEWTDVWLARDSSAPLGGLLGCRWGSGEVAEGRVDDSGEGLGGVWGVGPGRVPLDPGDGKGVVAERGVLDQ